MNGTLLTFMAIAWLIGFLHGWFGRGYSLKHKMYYDRVDDSLERKDRGDARPDGEAPQASSALKRSD